MLIRLNWILNDWSSLFFRVHLVQSVLLALEVLMVFRAPKVCYQLF